MWHPVVNLLKWSRDTNARARPSTARHVTPPTSPTGCPVQQQPIWTCGYTYESLWAPQTSVPWHWGPRWLSKCWFFTATWHRLPVKTSVSILQDAVLSFHWGNNQGIDLLIAHFKDQHLQTLFTCIFSDCPDQNTLSFYAFLWTLVQYLCTKLPYLWKVIYFSDGSGAWYKNRKTFINAYH